VERKESLTKLWTSKRGQGRPNSKLIDLLRGQKEREVKKKGRSERWETVTSSGVSSRCHEKKESANVLKREEAEKRKSHSRMKITSTLSKTELTFVRRPKVQTNWCRKIWVLAATRGNIAGLGELEKRGDCFSIYKARES